MSTETQTYTSSKQGTKRTLLIVGAALGIAIIGSAVYALAVRVSDSDYDKSLSSIESVKTLASQMVEQEAALRKGSIDKEKATTTAKTLAANYQAALTEFENTRGYQSDSVVKEKYDSASSIKEYGKKYEATALTQLTIGRIIAICGGLSGTGGGSYNSAAEPCTKALEADKSVPDSDYDKKYYQAYRSYFTSTMTAASSLSKVIENGDLNALKDAGKQYDALQQQASTSPDATPELPESITKDPRPAIDTIISLIQSHKQKLLR